MLFNGKGTGGWARVTASKLAQLIVDTQIERFFGTAKKDMVKGDSLDNVYRFLDMLDTFDYDQDEKTETCFNKIKAHIVQNLTEKLTP
jgi:hypothetical protein